MSDDIINCSGKHSECFFINRQGDCLNMSYCGLEAYIESISSHPASACRNSGKGKFWLSMILTKKVGENRKMLENCSQVEEKKKPRKKGESSSVFV